MPNPQYFRDPARKARILDAAAQLIAQRGFLGVNLADIGTAAGIVGSGVYRHFDSKAAILVELFDRVVDRLNSDAEGALLDCDDPAETLRALVRGQVRFAIDERELCRVYLQESHNLPGRDLRRLRWKQRHYIDLWQDALEAIRPELTHAKREVLIHTTISGIHSILRFRSPLNEDELAAFLELISAQTLGLDTAVALAMGEQETHADS